MASSLPKNSDPAPPGAEPLGLGPLEPLAANDERFRHLVEANPAIAWSVDARGQMTYANRRLRLHGPGGRPRHRRLGAPGAAP